MTNQLKYRRDPYVACAQQYPPPPQKWGGRGGGYGHTWGTAKHGTLPEFRLYQRRLEVGGQVTGHM